SGYYQIATRNATGQVWDVSGVSTADGALVHLWGYVAGNNQQWQPVVMNAPFYKFVARHSGKCLDVTGVSAMNGMQLEQWTCNGQENQSFRLSPVGGATPTPTPTATATPTGTRTATATSTATATTSAGGGTSNYTAAFWTQGNDPCTSSGPAGSGQP